MPIPLPKQVLKSAVGSSAFSEVAAANLSAWISKPTTSVAIVTPSPDKRSVAPHNKRQMIANPPVRQCAGLIVASPVAALELSVPKNRPAYVGAGAATHEQVAYLKCDRDDPSVRKGVSQNGRIAMDQVSAATQLLLMEHPEPVRLELALAFERL